MHITEIPIDTEIKVRVSLDNDPVNSLEFRTTVEEMYGESLLVTAIVNSEDKPISLSSDRIRVQVEHIDASGEIPVPIIWESVTIKYILKGRNRYHQIIQHSDGKTVNRRNAFRLSVGEKAILQFNVSKESIEVILKDISSTGFGFVTERDIDIRVTKMCMLKATIDDKKITLNGTIVRKQEVPESERFIYGCQLGKYSPELDKLIMSVQREKLQQQRQK